MDSTPASQTNSLIILCTDKLPANILKTKINFTQLSYIPFLGIGEWYFKCVEFILKFNQLFIWPFKLHAVAVINATTEARGQNKLFQNASLLMCYCSFAIEQFLILKNQSERQAIDLLL